MHDKPQGANGRNEAGSVASQGVVAEEALITVPLAAHHRTAEFVCTKSARVQGFFSKELPILTSYDYARVYVYLDAADAGRIVGYYTLSAASMFRAWLKNKYQKLVPGGIPAPMAYLGFMGKCDGAPKDLGGALVHDAALRAVRNSAMGVWGMLLDAENDDLVKKVYGPLGFALAASKNPEDKVPPRLMYAPLKSLL